MTMMQRVSIAATTALLFLLEMATATDISASCENCNSKLAKPVAFGCGTDKNNEPLYLTFNGKKLPCGSALTLDQAKTTPDVTYTDAKNGTLYSILLVDTTGKDPSACLKSPFCDYPLLTYGALNVPGEALAEGIPMSKFVRDGTNILVRAFQEYVAPDPPVPQEVPGFDTMDMTIFPFQYELMVGEQLREAGDNEPPDYTTPIRFGYDYIFAKHAPPNKVYSYFSSGACVVAVDAGEETPCDIKTEKGENAFNMEAWKTSMAAATGVPVSAPANGNPSPASLNQLNMLVVAVVGLTAAVLSVAC